ncbi:cell division cycle and apoptosis regulator protein 1-like [Topomyia yanbarensis]|uniref:cell division cycle and apoptosis regulator protein 1-like n=1 Tax=Topomyia yanbarensis TaxID=2498891 RepID=UPI00273AA880|nr:cell division cycle and apoptosis regulator protein 1-like [Topomyia yanbarensis]
MAFNQKNPPWQRNAGQNIAGMQALVSFPQAPVFNQNLGLQQQQNLSLIPQMSLQQQQIYSQPVQYPTSRTINTIAFQNQTQTSQQVGQSTSKFNPNQRVFSGTGHVTKVQNDFGFIDEEVFFHKNVCKGSFPKSGDRVLVEAAYNQNMPFKWNATRVQVLQSTSSSSVNSNNSTRHVSSYGSGQNSNNDRSGRSRYSPSRKSPDRHVHRTSHDSRQRDIDDEERRRRRDDRDVDRHREKQRDRTPERKDRDRSPVRKNSPKRRKLRPTPRYMVQMPKQLLTIKNADILELRRRYHTLYIPSDFFMSQIRWVDAFPPNEPFTIRKPCAFHVMHKDVEPLHLNEVNLEPADADYLYSAKVMLMSTPSMSDFYQKCFATGEERSDDDRDFVHPTRLINFLVGIRGKNETMAIGGPWSPSLDGENPHTNPNVLIKTAIRTCKGLTGIDLSNCSRWYRFVELYYRRSETYHKGRLIPARIETVVIFLPDVRSCLPTNSEWDELHLNYKSHLERIVNIRSSDSPESAESADVVAVVQQNQSEVDDNITSAEDTPTLVVATSSSSDSTRAIESSDQKPESTSPADNKKETAEEAPTVADYEKEVSDAASNNIKSSTESLDVKKMKIAELKSELEARNLSTDGVKNVLAARLIKALENQQTEIDEKGSTEVNKSATSGDKVIEIDDSDAEKLTEKNEDEEFETMDNVDMSEVTVIDEYDSTKSDEKSNDEGAIQKTKPDKLSEKERQLLEKRYSIPEQPHIIVHPSRTAKSGKFDCAVMSLSVLLDYRSEDSKEHSFEVSLFAELFNEMLTRDFGFNIYKAVHLIPVKKEEESKKDVIAEESVDKKVNGNGVKDQEKEIEENAKSKDDKEEREHERTRDRDSRRRSRFDDVSDEDRRRKEKEKKVSYYTFDRELLLSFTYFDVSHCGYIFDKDIEDLFFTLGLNLSRSQVRRMVAKALTRDMLYYRKLTDKVKETPDAIDEVNEQAKEVTNVKTNDETSDEVREAVQGFGMSEAELQELAVGNTNYLEQIENNLKVVLKAETSVDGDDGPPSKKIKVEQTHNEINIPLTSSGLVVHNGALLDVPKLLEQMRRSEKTREDSEVLLQDFRRLNADLQKNNSRANDQIKDQASDIKYLTRKLIDAEQNLREITKKSNEYFSTLSNVYDRVSTVMHRSESKRSSSITSSKRASSKDRLNRKERKSKEKDISEKPKSDVKESGDTPDVEIVALGDSKESINNEQSEAALSDNKKEPSTEEDNKEK